jgi:hypothetical protein
MIPRHQTEESSNAANFYRRVQLAVVSWERRRPRRQMPPGRRRSQGFNYIFYRLVFIALFCILCSVSAHAAGEVRTVEVESLRVTIDSEWPTLTAPGYWPVRFDITNLGDDRVIELYGKSFRYMGMMGEAGELDISQSIHLKRSDHVKLTIPVPIFADGENLQFKIRERGRILQEFNTSGLQSHKQPGETSALIITDSTTPFGAIAFGSPRSTTATPGAEHATPNPDLILDPLRIPSDWLGLTSVIAVFITPKEWEKLTGPQKEALLTWTASGGDLMYVDGDLSTLIPDPQTRPINMNLNEGNRAPYYFGHIHLLTSAELFAKGFEVALIQSRIAENSDFALPANRSSEWLKFSDYGFRLPIPGIEGMPVRSYLTILVVFSLLIGPVNFLWLRRKHRQILLLLTAPLISAVFILLLSAYAILGEGIGITVRAESFTLLDQKTNRAATRAAVSMYAAGMAPRNGLRFSRGVAVFPLGIDARGSRERQILDLTDSQQFTAGIAKVRSPANFEEISFRPARERLSFNKTDDGITVVNALGATITRLFYRDAGKVFMLDLPLKAGEKAPLHIAASGLGDLPPKFHFLQEITAEHSYIAWLESSPFLETGAPDVKERGSLHLVLGYAGEKQ